LAQLIKESLKKDGIKKDVKDLVKKKIENIKPTAKILKDNLNIIIVFPTEAQIDSYVEKVCNALTDTNKKGDNIKIDNLITATYEEPTVRKKPS
jgi:nucleoid DNA-binding protein